MPVQDIYKGIIERDEEKVIESVKAELDKGTDIFNIMNNGLIAPMDEVGRQFSEGQIFLPEMMKSALTMKAGMELLRPFLSDIDSKSAGTVVIGTVKGDLHDIGKDLVIMMLEGGGFKVVDLGVDVDPKKFVEAVNEHEADVVALSALLTTTMPAMGQIVAHFKKEGLGVKSMVGGAPINSAFADKIGADGYGEDAPSAVKLAREFLYQNKE
ncbi:MAG: corrinoid protein [Desulfobacteraceae bacterium]|nr:corrinoid protein [Desulfobacteraceae bacterium]